MRFMRALGRLVAEQLEYEELEARNRCLAIDAAGLQAFLAAIEVRDSYVGDHSRFVAALATGVARLMGLPEGEAAGVRQAALLHDVGKVGIPDSILNKRGPLDDAEIGTMREHAALGRAWRVRSRGSPTSPLLSRPRTSAGTAEATPRVSPGRRYRWAAVSSRLRGLARHDLRQTLPRGTWPGGPR
jgi:hypothetical protein